MIRHLYPGKGERARALGIWVAVSSLGLALGPLIGGLLVYGWSWRAIFWFNVFFGTLAFVSAVIVLPESSDPVKARFDILGFLLGSLAGSNVIAFTNYFGTLAIFFMVALYLQVVGAKSPLGLALNFVPLAVGMVATSLLTGRWWRHGARASRWPRAV
jgi:MFS family permease